MCSRGTAASERVLLLCVNPLTASVHPLLVLGVPQIYCKYQLQALQLSRVSRENPGYQRSFPRLPRHSNKNPGRILLCKNHGF